MFKVIRSIAVTVAVVATMHIACASAKKPVFYPHELKHMKGKSVDTAEQSCFKYNYDVFGKSLRAFGQIINTMEYSNVKNVLPEDLVFSFKVNALQSPDVVKTKFKPPRSRMSLLQLNDDGKGARIVPEAVLVRPRNLNAREYTRIATDLAMRLKDLHMRAQSRMHCSFSRLKSFANERRCFILFKESKTLEKKLDSLLETLRAVMKNPVLLNKGKAYCKSPVRWTAVLKSSANLLMTLSACTLDKFGKGKCENVFQNWFGQSRTCRGPMKMNLNGGANGVEVFDVSDYFPTLMMPVPVHAVFEIENSEKTYLAARDMRFYPETNSATVFYNCGGVAWKQCLASLECGVKRSTTLAVKHNSEDGKFPVRGRFRITVSNANFAVEDLSAGLKHQLGDRRTTFNMTFQEKMNASESISQRRRLNEKVFQGSS